MWVCGFCGEPEWKLRRGELAREHYLFVMGQHALTAHQVNMGELDEARGDGHEWVLPDGRVWLRKVDQ